MLHTLYAAKQCPQLSSHKINVRVKCMFICRCRSSSVGMHICETMTFHPRSQHVSCDCSRRIPAPFLFKIVALEATLRAWCHIDSNRNLLCSVLLTKLVILIGKDRNGVECHKSSAIRRHFKWHTTKTYFSRQLHAIRPSPSRNHIKTSSLPRASNRRL